MHAVSPLSSPSGLVRLGEEVGLSLLAPRKKITVMLIGNHSAGKSSFINWSATVVHYTFTAVCRVLVLLFQALTI